MAVWLNALLRALRSRALFALHAAIAGVTHVGEVLNRNFIVGALFLLGVLGITIALFFGILPSVVMFSFICLAVLADGAYLEWKKADEAARARPQVDIIRLEIKNLLGKRRATMNALVAASDEIIREGQATADFIEAAFGEGEGQVFAQGSHPMMFRSGTDSDWQHRARQMLHDLDALIVRTDTIAIRADFDLKQWQKSQDCTSS
jgi:hypothetical protein